MQVQVPATKLRSNLGQISTALDTENNADICAAIGSGDFAIVKITSGSVTEDVKVGACSQGVPYIIERGVNNTEARFFPSGACITPVTGVATVAACPAVVNQTWALPASTTAKAYSASHNTGFTKACLSDYSAPEGYEVELVGGILTINASCPVVINDGVVVAEITQDDCIVAVVTGSLSVSFECPPDTTCD